MLTDPSVEESLIAQHMGLVRSRAVRHAYSVNRPDLIEDLEAEGRAAMVRAIDAYDPNRGVEFATYAMSIINGAMLHYVRDRVHTIRVPRACWHELHPMMVPLDDKVDEDIHPDRPFTDSVESRVVLEQSFARLTDRQREAMAMIVGGATIGDVARARGVCWKTAQKHVLAAARVLAIS